MLHRLKPPTESVESNLFALVDRQRQLLDYARRHNTYNEQLLDAELGHSFASWLTARRQNDLLEALKQLIICSEAEKDDVLNGFDHDQEFWAPVDESLFQFAFSPTKTKAHEHAKKCLNTFYKSIPSLAPLLPSPQQFRPEDIIEGYIATNPFLKLLCPCCDGSWPEQAGRERTPYTLEHFFHKDAHPTVCLHPYNLIPVCGVCNTRRGNKEVLESDSEKSLGIHKIFHPLFRPAKEYVELQYYSRGLNPERLQFVNLPTQLDDWREAIEVYDLVYEIPKRWQGQWHQIDEVIGIQIRAGLQGYLSREQPPISLSDFEGIISRIIKDLKEPPGRYQYPAHRWLEWAKQYRLENLYEAHVKARDLHIG